MLLWIFFSIHDHLEFCFGCYDMEPPFPFLRKWVKKFELMYTIHIGRLPIFQLNKRLSLPGFVRSMKTDILKKISWTLGNWCFFKCSSSTETLYIISPLGGPGVRCYGAWSREIVILHWAEERGCKITNSDWQPGGLIFFPISIILKQHLDSRFLFHWELIILSHMVYLIKS